MDKGTEKLKELMSKCCFIVSSVRVKMVCRSNYFKKEQVENWLNFCSFWPVDVWMLELASSSRWSLGTCSERRSWAHREVWAHSCRVGCRVCEPRGHPEPWRTPGPCVLLAFFGWSVLLGRQTVRKSAHKWLHQGRYNSRCKALGTELLWSCTWKQLSGLLLWLSPGQWVQEIPPFQWTAWKWSSTVECSSLGKFFLWWYPLSS